jgi:hypothetical protein
VEPQGHGACSPRKPFAGFRRNGKDLHIRIDLANAVFNHLKIQVEIGQQVDLVDQGGIADPEHQGVFNGFVFTFGDREHHHALVLADIEFGRADQIADVLHDEQVDGIQVQVGHGPFDHVGRQVAVAAEFVGVDLDHRCTAFGQLVGVVGGADVPHHDGTPQGRHDGLQAADQGGGLAGARGTHHIHDKDLVVGELVPQAIRHHVVGVEHLADHLDFTRPGTVGFNDGAPFIVMQVGTLGVVMKMVLGSV